ncbi:MAG: hypothetical protein H0V01_01255 [Bacteroidetes bacterium]|nr:hypothetical protein [Bacteroidota bacterium]HET6243167.1 hypothetical protein [Bacteroidia bacterium]
MKTLNNSKKDLKNSLNRKKSFNLFGNKMALNCFGSLFLFLLTGLTITTSGQNNSIKYGASINKTFTGSGVKTLISPSVSVQKERFSLSAGPNIKNVNFDLSGGHLEVRFLPPIENPTVSLFFHYSSVLNVHTTMNYSCEVERKVNLSEKLDQRVNAYEHYVGFGIENTLTNAIFLQTSIGVGAIHTTFSDGSNLTMATVMFKLGINIRSL